MSSQNSKTQLLTYTLYTRNTLTADESELYELAVLAGVTIDPKVFKILVDLLKMNVAPTAIERMLKSIVSHKVSRSSSK